MSEKHVTSGPPPGTMETMGSQAVEQRRSDLDLARRCVRGERDAQRALFSAHRERVHVILYRILGTNRDIDDLLQDAFLEIFRGLPTFRGDAKLGTWIDRITTRVAWQHLAHRKDVPAAALELVRADDTGPDRRAELREAARRLYGILERLEPAQRVAFALHVIDGRPMREVADVMSASVVATKVRVFRARRAVEKRARLDPLLSAFLGAEAAR